LVSLKDGQDLVRRQSIERTGREHAQYDASTLAVSCWRSSGFVIERPTNAISAIALCRKLIFFLLVLVLGFAGRRTTPGSSCVAGPYATELVGTVGRLLDYLPVHEPAHCGHQ